MKRYFFPLAAAIILNIVIISLVLWGHHRHPAIAPLHQAIPSRAIIPTSQDSQSSYKATKAWFNQHYHGTVQVTQDFPVSKQIHGYIIALKSDPTTKQIVYSVDHGKFFLLGSMLDHNGHNLTIQHQAHFVDTAKNKVIYQATRQLHGILQGNPSHPIITIIIDPNDHLFPQIWDNLRTDIASGVFSVQWVLVNYIKPMGPNTAGAILQSKHPLQALQYAATHYDTATQTGGYAAQASLTKRTIEQLRAHWDFVQRFNLFQLPITVVHRGKQNHVLHGFMMDETLEMLLKE